MNTDSINTENSELSVSVSSILRTLHDVLTDPIFAVRKKKKFYL